MNSRLLLSSPIQVVCLSLLLATGCKVSKAEIDGYSCADFLHSGIYYGRPPEARSAEIRSYPLDKQYAVFICGVQHMRPPDWETAQPFAEHGNATAEFLVAKLPLIRDDRTIENIVTLIGDMNALGTYKLKKNSELERALQLAVSGMKDQIQKKRVQNALGLLIEKGSSG